MGDFGLSSLMSLFSSAAPAAETAAATIPETAAATLPAVSALGNPLAVGTADAGIGMLAPESAIAETTITGAPSAFGTAAGATPATLGWLTPENIMRGLSVGGALKSAIQPSGSVASPASSVQPATPPSSGGNANNPNFVKDETARWMQQLANTGQLGPNGQLPQSIQDMINRQAVLRA